MQGFKVQKITLIWVKWKAFFILQDHCELGYLLFDCYSHAEICGHGLYITSVEQIRRVFDDN